MTQFLSVDGVRLEVARIPGDAPTLVWLHEGLGSAELWRDVPDAVSARSGLGSFVYSRRGYGHSDPVSVPRPLTYMHEEGRVLPAVLDAAGIDQAILVGHSDGGSIALLAAAAVPDRVRALVLEAPHVFCEDISVRSIEEARTAYLTGDLRARLARFHDDVDGAFWGWNRAWLDPGFRAWNIEAVLPRITVPTLVIQGEQDPYGTLAQVDAVERGLAGPVTRCILPDCGHSPHRDRRDAVLDAIATFVASHRG